MSFINLVNMQNWFINYVKAILCNAHNVDPCCCSGSDGSQQNGNSQTLVTITKLIATPKNLLLSFYHSVHNPWTRNDERDINYHKNQACPINCLTSYSIISKKCLAYGQARINIRELRLIGITFQKWIRKIRNKCFTS